MRYVILYIAILGYPLLHGQNLVINEAMNNAFISLEDENGDFPNWVEIYNPLPAAVNLKDYYLSPAANNLLNYQLPDSLLLPGDHTVVLLSGKNKISDFSHANFKWSNIQNRLYLSTSTGQIIDEITMPELSHDVSYGRETDGASSFVAFSEPSPGASNNSRSQYTPKNEGLFVWPLDGWFKSDSIRVEITGTNPNLDIRYTLDGSTPTLDALKYEGSFWLHPNPTDTFYYATIRTNPQSSSSSWRWRQPHNMPSKNNVLAVAAFQNGKQVSPTEYRHWFIGKSKPEHKNSVVSIISDPDGLFGYENGIYVHGINYYEGPGTNWSWGTGNYHQRGRHWERLSHISLFENDGSVAFSQKLGIRIHGGGSRALPMKSLRLYPRNIYGESRINYPIFPNQNKDSYNRVLMRNGGQDFMSRFYVDAFSSEIAINMGLIAQLSRPVTHYINGEYWGVINFRERVDEAFISHRTGIPENEIFFTSISSSSWTQYDIRWENFTTELDVLNDPEEIEVLLEKHLDIKNFIDYFLFRVYIGVYDWPGNNRALWRTHSDTSLYRNIVFDCDDAFSRYDENNLKHATTKDGDGWPNPPWSTLVFRKMLSIERYRKMTIKRMEELIMTEFHPDHLDSINNNFISNYEPLMTDHINRWQFPGNDISDWYEQINKIATFINKRPCYIREFFRSEFNLDEDYFNQFKCDEDGFIRSIRSPFLEKIYPNPTSGNINVTLDIPSGSEYFINITSITGQIIYSESFRQGQKKFTHTIDALSGQPSGNYILSIENGGGINS